MFYKNCDQILEYQLQYLYFEKNKLTNINFNVDCFSLQSFC